MEIQNIIEGWSNHILSLTGKPPKKEWLDKLEICLNCEHTNHGEKNKCSLCGCPLVAKVKSKSKCPIKKW